MRSWTLIATILLLGLNVVAAACAVGTRDATLPEMRPATSAQPAAPVIEAPAAESAKPIVEQPAKQATSPPANRPAQRQSKARVRKSIPAQNLEIPDALQPCAENLRKIAAAIEKYQKDNGKMPDWLSDLVPNYLDKKALLCPVKRTKRAPVWPDPKLPCSYNYEFSPTRLSGNWGPVSHMVCRDWKTLQIKLFGNVVPTVRCTHGRRVLNASAGGQVYWSGETWEPLFMPTYRRGDELPSPPERRQREALDGFDGKLLLKWQIRNVDLSHFSLTKKPGALTITTQKGGFWTNTTNYKNLFLIENPIATGRDFELTTCLLSFKPTAAFQQAGLVCFNDEDNYIKFVDESGKAADQPRFTLIRETRGRVAPHTYVDWTSKGDRVWLRLTKRGNRYVYSSSFDGKSFRHYGELPWGDGAPKWVGLVAKNAANSDAPEIDASFDFFAIRARATQQRLVIEGRLNRYVVPSGGVAELLKFIESVKKYRPKTLQEAVEHNRRAPAALKVAATRILQSEKDEWSEAFQTALRVLLEDRIRTLGTATPAYQQETLTQVKTFLTAKAERGFAPQDLRLAMSVARALEYGDDHKLAAEAYASFAELLAKSENEKLIGTANLMQGAARRLRLLGHTMRLTGTTMDGTPLNWDAYRGKVVLVDFWATWCAPCRAELPNVKENYKLYHDRGFEVVGISTDRSRAALEKFLDKEKLPWVTLYDQEAEGGNPMAKYYGVMAIPTVLLVDKEGKVVSLRARGAELDRKLEELLGPPFMPKGKLTLLDLKPNANQKLTETLHNLPDNDLKELPQGEQTFSGVRFTIADTLIQLHGQNLRTKRPEKVERISVNQPFARLYILHGTGWGGTELADGTLIGRYQVDYADGSTETIPIVYGLDVRNWTTRADTKPTLRGRVAWTGTNAYQKRIGGTVRLYLGVWENPHPDKPVERIEYASANTVAAPFCIAMTVEARE